MIEELISGNDGLIRAAKLRTASGRTNRPITRLYPLEVMADPRNIEDVTEDRESGITDGAEKKGESDLDQTSATTRPPVRDSANRAKERMMKWSKTLSESWRMSRITELPESISIM